MIGKEFALQVPEGAVAMDAEEMMYVEGGAYIISRKTCRILADACATGATLAGIFAVVAGHCGNALAAMISGIASMGLGWFAYQFSNGASYNGLYVTWGGLTIRY